MDKLQEARKIINEVDTQLVQLFQRRMEAAELVAAHKQTHGLPILDAAREAEVIRKGAEQMDREDLRSYYMDFMENVMAISRQYQHKLMEGMQVAYSGLEEAAAKLFPNAQAIDYPDFKTAYDAVVEGACHVAVLPLENSYAGAVEQVTDLIFSGPLHINGILSLESPHHLLGVEGSTRENIKTINCSQVNTTRFAVLSRYEDRNISKKQGAHFVLMFRVKNETGALDRALNIITTHGFTMRTLRSCPMKELRMQQYFYGEAEGDIHTPKGAGMLKELTVCCEAVKCIGSFIA